MPQCQIGDLRLSSGQILRDAEVAYAAYGELNDAKSNAVLATHGITSSHLGGDEPTPDRRRGWWREVIGPGKLFDTERYCVICPNVLGSCYGSTGPTSISPETGRVYGGAFPDITYQDVVASQRALLDRLGVERLVAVAGASIGGFQAFQWAVSFPNAMGGVIALDTATRDIFDSAKGAPTLVERFSRDPNWNDGDYSLGGMTSAMTELRVEMLKSFGFEERFHDFDSQREKQDFLRDEAQAWAREFDPQSLLVLQRAVGRYDVEPELSKITVPVFYVLADTDEWFPASIGEEVMGKLNAAGVEARFHGIESPYGHYATTEEPEKWTPQARAFLDAIEPA